MQDPARPIRFPSRIPDTLAALLSAVEGTLGGLREQLDRHQGEARKRLRLQVRGRPYVGAVLSVPTRQREWTRVSCTGRG
jgi:hypothetical protein